MQEERKQHENSTQLSGKEKGDGEDCISQQRKLESERVDKEKIPESSAQRSC